MRKGPHFANKRPHVTCCVSFGKTDTSVGDKVAPLALEHLKLCFAVFHLREVLYEILPGESALDASSPFTKGTRVV